MKILHTADWHLGKKLDDYTRLSEQRLVLAEICDIAESENVDLVLLAGDIFDSFNPSNEAIELLYQTLHRLSNNGTRPVLSIAGNHDSPDKIESPDVLAQLSGILFFGYPDSVIQSKTIGQNIRVLNSEPGFIELQIPAINYPVRLLYTPYANEYRLKTFLNKDNSENELREVLEKKWTYLAENYCDNNGVNLLMSHLFFMKKDAEQEEEPDDEKSILHIGGAQAIYTHAIPKQIQYVALGHLHRPHAVTVSPCEIVYSGSPLAYSFGEVNQQKTISIIDIEPGQQVTRREVNLSAGSRLLRSKFNNIKDAVTWLINHKDHYVEITLVSDTYITSEQRKQLLDVHDKIVNIVPEINVKDELTSTQIDLSQNREVLFNEYFKSKNGQEPNEEILALFKEITAL